MTVHQLNQPNTAQNDIRNEAVYSATNFINNEGMALWDVCDLLGESAACDAVEELVGLADGPSPSPTALLREIEIIVDRLMGAPFVLVDAVEGASPTCADLGNALRFYGARLTDLAQRLRAAGPRSRS